MIDPTTRPAGRDAGRMLDPEGDEWALRPDQGQGDRSED